MPNTQDLLAALNQLEGNTTQLQQQVNGFDSGLVSARNDLEIPIDLASKLSSLNDVLSTSSNLLEVIGIIPAIGEAANILNEAIEALQGPVSAASSAANSAAATIRPVRDAVAQLESRVQQLGTGLGRSVQAEQTFGQALTQAQSCINSQPAGAFRNTLDKQLDTASGIAQPVVAKAASIVGTVNGELASLQNDLNAAEAKLQSLASISGAVDSVMSTLSAITGPMESVANALSHDITIPVGPPIPHKVCFEGGFIPYPCDWYPPTITFSVEDIIKGVKGVLGPFESLLDSAMHAILDPVLGALHIPTSLPPIPGIGDLANDVTSLLGSLGNLQNEIGGFFNDLDTFSTDIQNVSNTIAGVQTVLARCQAGK